MSYASAFEKKVERCKECGAVAPVHTADCSVARSRSQLETAQSAREQMDLLKKISRDMAFIANLLRVIVVFMLIFIVANLLLALEIL